MSENATNSNQSDNWFNDFKMRTSTTVPPLPVIENNATAMRIKSVNQMGLLWQGILIVIILGGAFDHAGYRYYDFLRTTVCVSFAYWFYIPFSKSRNHLDSTLCAAIVIIFNPAIKFSFEKETWQIIDCIVIAIIICKAIYRSIAVNRNNLLVTNEAEQIKERRAEAINDINDGKSSCHLILYELQNDKSLNAYQKKVLSLTMNRIYKHYNEERRKEDYDKLVMALALEMMAKTLPS
jgi:hypothetical protein